VSILDFALAVIGWRRAPRFVQRRDAAPCAPVIIVDGAATTSVPAQPVLRRWAVWRVTA
jgi:hypothetical protein